MQRNITGHEVINHGVDHEQYFPGCGIAFTSYDDVATGIGDTSESAYEDALDSLAQAGWDVDALPSAQEQGLGTETVENVIQPSEDESCDGSWWFVSVRVKG